MSWFILAIIGHISNGVAFVIDKALLNTALKRSATYAAMVGGLSLATLVAIPWIKEWPTGNLIPIVALFGVVFVLALWAFFEALKRSEATRVVPIVGSLIPILTLLRNDAAFWRTFIIKTINRFRMSLDRDVDIDRRSIFFANAKRYALDVPYRIISFCVVNVIRKIRIRSRRFCRSFHKL